MQFREGRSVVLGGTAHEVPTTRIGPITDFGGRLTRLDGENRRFNGPSAEIQAWRSSVPNLLSDRTPSTSSSGLPDRTSDIGPGNVQDCNDAALDRAPARQPDPCPRRGPAVAQTAGAAGLTVAWDPNQIGAASRRLRGFLRHLVGRADGRRDGPGGRQPRPPREPECRDALLRDGLAQWPPARSSACPRQKSTA